MTGVAPEAVPSPSGDDNDGAGEDVSR